MSNLNVYYNRDDRDKAVATALGLGAKLGKRLDVKKLKRASESSIITLIGILKREVAKLDNYRVLDKPVAGKTYSLTGGSGTPSIANGNTWAESEVKN